MISVIIPVYNGEKTIEGCLKSLLNQNYEYEYEVIVVDDASEDKTVEIVRKYPVKLLTQTHRGPAAARNLGAKNSKGDILLFTDSDCIFDKDWIREMLKPIKNKEMVGVQGRYKTRQTEIIAKFAQYEIEERYKRMSKSRYIDFMGSYSAAYKKDIFLKEGGFDETFLIASGEDPDLSFRLASKGYKMVFNPRAIVYHKHPNTLKKYLKQKFFRASWRLPLYKKNYKKTIRDTYTPQLLKVQIGLFYLIMMSLLTILYFITISYLPLILLLLMILTTLPFSFSAFKKDKVVGIVSPLIITLRSVVFGLGLIYGILRDVSSSS